MKRMMLLDYKQDTFDCPVCNKDKFHRYTQMFYHIHWCESCENYFTIENKSGKRYVYLLNENESKPIKKKTIALTTPNLLKWSTFFIKNQLAFLSNPTIIQKPIKKTKPSKLKEKTKDLKYMIEKRKRQTQKKKIK